MPPPSYCDNNRNSARSTKDHEPELECDYNNSKSESTNSCGDSSEEESIKPCIGYDGVGIVKSFLGPSFEDAVLRTLEFGKALIQKQEENEAEADREKKFQRDHKKETCKNETNLEGLDEEFKKSCKSPDVESSKKRVVFTAKLDREVPLVTKPNPCPKKLTNVSKIRSLDSDLKQAAPSPEKIKRQLEALIQINKDEPPEHNINWIAVQKPQPVEMTAMPSLCMYRNDMDCNCSSSGDIHSRRDQGSNDQCSTSRLQCGGQERPKKRLGAPPGLCQAPEFISNALGPTLDVSIIDNLKMMRDIFKCESGKGEGLLNSVCRDQVSVCSHTNRSEDDMQGKCEDLVRKIKELEHKEKCLLEQIEQEEIERECRRRAFEEEERRLCSMQACLANEDHKKDCGKSGDLEHKHECLRQRIQCEEEKLSRLKDQYECYKRELIEMKNKKEALKRNKSLLDAWDVIASRVCHTRLPSFSRAYNLERKQFKSGDAGNIHCCFLPQETPTSDCKGTRHSRSRSRCGSRCGSRCASKSGSGNFDVSRSKESLSSAKCKPKPEELAFPIQRDITCGLHQCLKTCSCSQSSRNGMTCSSDDELLKKCGTGTRESKKGDSTCTLSLESDPEKIIGKPPKAKPVCRSRSETTMKKDKCSKIVKVLWAVTRINIFQDNCRTYEVMDATCTPPPCMPTKTEGIFVVKNPQKRLCSSRKRSNSHAPC